MLRKHLRRATAVALSLTVLLICSVRGGYSQTFSSGSTGADGALNYPTPGTFNFDPKSFSPPLNTAGDNVFNFTTINIASGVTLKMSNKILTGPVYWLAQGNVTIHGTIDLRGEDGHSGGTQSSLRVPAAGGAGGYSGGAGGTQGAGLPAAQPGNGPGGGAASSAPGVIGSAGTFTGSQYLIPLIGGSGGGGGLSPVGAFGAGGGGGGGALLIASSTSIALTSGAIIYAAGGNGGAGAGGGAGGAIRLIAPVVTIDGSSCTCIYGNGTGLTRLEGFTVNVSPSSSIRGPFIISTPLSPAVPATLPSALKVTSLIVGGITVPINANPFSFPDATINSSTPVTVNVQAQFIPLGTVPKIIVMSETGPDQTVNCSALQGPTIQQSTCSALITFPTGGSRGFVKATWTQ